MEKKEFQFPFKCLFCGCRMKGDIEKIYHSGDMIKCQECDELNDYDSVLELAIEEGTAAVVDFAEVEVKKILKGILK